jgi:hypothetical protein
MIEIIDGVAREYEWQDGQWVLVKDSPWNEADADDDDFSS